jgi:hypothetical protein
LRGRKAGEQLTAITAQTAGISGGILHRVLNVPGSQISLNQPRIRALIDKRIATRVSQRCGWEVTANPASVL